MCHKKMFSFSFCLNFLVLCYANVTPQNVNPSASVSKFQNGLQQQNFYTILSSIEDRLRSLDNIYSLQLSQTLENKLELYSRKLESLDTKIIRLEALVMLNLDKISENISTKNFKDDVGRTTTFRKMDSLYESLNHRLNYIDRRHETNFEKIQEKLDKTISHISKVEENLSTRGSDLETELSDAIFAIDELKNTYGLMEIRINNMTETTLNISKENYELLKKWNNDNKKSMNKLHDNIVGNLQYMDNKTSHAIKFSQETNDLIKKMKSELKEDFNNYANKVADMNSDIWKSSDTTEDDLNMIATVVNNTKTELQNGVRSLMIQIGKISNKDNNTSMSSTQYEDLDKKMTENFNKILMNQDVFMDSCHRLQMDEAQIETEISVMLEKLIDMLEKKLVSETKDIRSIEKTLKSHDARVNRNLHQANNNIVSLFEKYTINNQQLSGDVKQIENDLNALFSFIQTTLNDGMTSSKTQEMKMALETLNKILNSTETISKNKKRDTESIMHSLSSLQAQFNNISLKCTPVRTEDDEEYPKIIIVFGPSSNTTKDNSKSILETFAHSSNKPDNKIDEDTSKSILEVFGRPANETEGIKTNGVINEDVSKSIQEVFGRPPNKTDHKIDEDTSKSILEVFGHPPNRTEDTVDADTSKSILEVFGRPSNQSEDNVNEDVSKSILEVFGRPPNDTKVQTATQTVTPEDEDEEDFQKALQEVFKINRNPSSMKTICQLNLQYIGENVPADCVENSNSNKNHKPQINIRADTDSQNENEANDDIITNGTHQAANTTVGDTTTETMNTTPT